MIIQKWLKKAFPINIVIMLLFANISNANVNLFSGDNNKIDLNSSSNPDNPCMQVSLVMNPAYLNSTYTDGANDIYAGMPFIKYGTKFGLLSIDSKMYKADIIMDTFLELSAYNFLFWRANVGIYIDNEFNIISKDNTKDELIIGINHESAHYTLDLDSFESESDALIQLSSFLSFPFLTHSYESIFSKLYHQITTNKINIILGLGVKKYFSVIDYTFTRSFNSSINLDIIFEKPFKNNHNVYFSLYYELIQKNMEPAWHTLTFISNMYFPESYYDEYIKSDYLHYFIIQFGFSIKNKTKIQPYLIYMNSNGRGLDFLNTYNYFGLGIKVFP